MKRKICVFTSTRADYGLLRWTLLRLAQEAGVELQILCSGTHLAPEFGYTVREIESDGLPIAYRCEMLLASDSPSAVSKSIGLAVMGYGDAYQQLSPDLVIILGDRFEALAAGLAATVFGIPIAHLHGGELTQGAMDDSFRHSLTKLSHLHFCSSAGSAARIRQLGEMPERVFQVGALGVESVNRTRFLEKQDLEEFFGLSLDRPTWLATYHPATLETAGSDAQIREFLMALNHFPEVQVVFTLPNSDPGNLVIRELIQDYARQHGARCRAYVSLGQTRYLSLARFCQAVIGNSSSGILEAPALRVPTLNVGTRQDGRERASSIVDCGWQRDEIARGLARLTSEDFLGSLATIHTPYGNENASEKIVPVLTSVELAGLGIKRFVDLSPATLGS